MATWNLDKAHSEIEFRVRHMMISTVKGQLKNFDVNVDSESEDLSNAKISATIDVSSINTGNEQRDEHLKSVDFFNVEEFPNITFISTKINRISDDEFEVEGDLTIRDITKPKKLKVELGGVAKDPWGNIKVGYSLRGAINRTDFGLVWNAALETGGVMVSEEVKFTADIQLIKA